MKPDATKAPAASTGRGGSNTPEELDKPNDSSWAVPVPCVVMSFMRQPLSSVSVTHRYLDYTDTFNQERMDPFGEGRFLGYLTILAGWEDLNYWDVSARTIPDGQLVNVTNKDQLILPEDFNSGLPVYLMIYGLEGVRIQNPRSNPWGG